MPVKQRPATKRPATAAKRPATKRRATASPLGKAGRALVTAVKKAVPDGCELDERESGSVCGGREKRVLDRIAVAAPSSFDVIDVSFSSGPLASAMATPFRHHR